jgi:hypothetical protein
MKLTTLVVMALALAPAAVRAHGPARMRQNAKMLDQAATALQSSKPELAGRLHELAVQDKRDAQMGVKEKMEAADIQLLLDSSAALKASDPKLSQRLSALAEEEAREHHSGMNMKQKSMQPEGTQQPSTPQKNPSPNPGGGY